MAIAIAQLTQPDFYNRALEREKAQFITINFSHYGELARWTLLASRQDFDEYNFSPGQHVLATLRIRVAGKEKHLNDSSRMFGEKKGGSPTAVPVAVLPNGDVLLDSWHIARYSMPESHIDERLRSILDEEIGPLSRKLLYLHLLKDENLGVFNRMWEMDAGWLWRSAWAVCRSSFVHMMRTAVGFGQPDVEEQAEQDLLAAFDKIEKEHLHHLHDDVGQPTLPDYALAALCAPIVSPKEFCGGRIASELDCLLQQDAKWSAMVARFRATALGKHCSMMYAKHRPLLPATSHS